MKPFGDDDCLETELMRQYGFSGPPRLLLTIVEETKEELESKDERSRGRRLSELMLAAETPFMTLLAFPSFYTTPQSPCYRTHKFNPLFDSSNDEVSRMRSASPPPKFKFLKDAEEKLYRGTLMEEVIRVHKNGGASGDVAMQQPVDSTVPSPPNREEGDGSFITIFIAKNKEKGHVNHHQHHLSSSQAFQLMSYRGRRWMQQLRSCLRRRLWHTRALPNPCVHAVQLNRIRNQLLTGVSKCNCVV